MSFTKEGGSKEVEVTSNDPAGWTATSSASWLKIDGDSKYNGKDFRVLTLTAEAFPIGDKREAVITITDNEGNIEEVNVTQLGDKLSLYVNPDIVSFNVEGGSQDLTVASNVTWSSFITYTNSDENWLSITGENGENNGTITLTAVANNSGSERKAMVIVKGQNQEFRVNVTQLGGDDDFQISPRQIISYKDGGKWDVSISGNFASWKISEDYEWIHIDKNYLEGNFNTIRITLDANAEKSARNAIIDVIGRPDIGSEKNHTINITQSGTEELVFNDGEKIYFTVRKQQKDIEIKGANSINWTPDVAIVNGKDGWLTVGRKEIISSDSKQTTYRLPLILQENEIYKDQSANVILNYEDGYGNKNSVKLNVTQAHRPKKPTALNISRADYSSKNIDSTFGEDVLLNIITDDGSFDEMDSYDKWSFIWTVDDNTTLTGNAHNNVYELKDKEPHKLTVTAVYKDAPDIVGLHTHAEYYIYPAPLTPKELLVKGQGEKKGTSGIMIAMMDTTKVKYEQLKADGYKFVFGYDDLNGSPVSVSGTLYDTATSNRYFQYNDKSLVQNGDINKWVYTMWHIDTRNGIPGRDVKSITRCNTNGDPSPIITRSSDVDAIEGIEAGDVVLRRGRLMAKLESPAAAQVTVVSMSGTVVKRQTLSARREFDEVLDLNGLPGGLYVIRCTIGNHRAEEKLVIK